MLKITQKINLKKLLRNFIKNEKKNNAIRPACDRNRYFKV